MPRLGGVGGSSKGELERTDLGGRGAASSAGLEGSWEGGVLHNRGFRLSACGCVQLAEAGGGVRWVSNALAWKWCTWGRGLGEETGAQPSGQGKEGEAG